ncbi:MAG: efflux RND transporter periplasmic adaptor subunit [Bacteroidota bacterium]
MASKKTKRILIYGIIAVVVLLVVARKAGWIGGEEQIRVNAEPVTRETITETVTASGKVQPETEVKITSDVSGEVVELIVKEGDVVQKGALLAKINPEIYISAFDRVAASVNTSKANLGNAKSRLKQAESQFQKTELTYNRNKKLYDDKVISDSEFETVRSAYEVAKAEVDAARQSIAAAEFGVKSAEASLAESKENLNKTSIFAPVDGTISKLSVERGERVVGTEMMAGTEVLRLANLNEMEVSVDVSESDIIRVNLGDTAKIEIDAYLNRIFTGVVSSIANSANNAATAISTDQVTNFTVKVRINRESYADLIPADKPSFSPFRPGMSATVEIQTKRAYDVVSVPIQAVTTRDTSQVSSSKEIKRQTERAATTTDSKPSGQVQECVFVLNEDGTVQFRRVKTAIQDNQFIQILEGLKEGEQVVTAPYSVVSRTLNNGDKVVKVSKEELFNKKQ